MKALSFTGSSVMRTLGLPLVIAFGVPLWAGRAQAAECRMSRAVEVITKHIRQGISEDTTVSAAKILRLAGPARAARHFPLLGMSKSTLSYALTTKIDIGPAEGGLMCASPESLKLTIGYVGRVVFVAREAAGDPCLLRANLQHQLAHAHSDDGALEAFLPTLSHRLKSAIGRISFRPASSAAVAKAVLNAEIAKRLKSLLDVYEEHRDAIQTAIDNPHELARLRDVCVGRGRRIVENASAI